MRRLVLFLVVLGLGSAVLWHFEDRRITEDEQRAQRRAEREQAAGLTPVDEPRDLVPPTPPPEVGSDAPREWAILRGKVGLVWRGTEGQPDLHFDAEDLQPADAIGERYDARGVVVESRLVDAAERSVVRETVNAARGTFALLVDRERGVPDKARLSPEEPLALEDVVIVRHVDAPVLPLELRAPRVDALVAEERYESLGDDEVEVLGPGLSGAGREVVFDGASGELRLGREWRMRLVMRGGEVVDFQSTGEGPLALVRRPDDESVFDMVADGGARLELVGTPPATLDARRIELVVRSLIDPESGDEVRVLETAIATGDVVVTQDQDRFVGERARVETRGGQLRRVVLEDSPGARVTVRDETGARLDVTVSGAGPLIVDVQEAAVRGERRASFGFAGPGRIDAPARGVSIAFEDRCDADAREDQGRARLVAVGDVVLTREDLRIETASLAATFLGERAEVEEQPGSLVVDGIVAVTEGPTKLTAGTRDGGNQRADARGGLAAHLDGERWIVDRATDVTFEVQGAEPFRAAAGELTAIDLDARTFDAAGAVRYESLWGEATATSGMARGTERLELHGTDDEPARIVFAPDAAVTLNGGSGAAPGTAPGTSAPLGVARSGELSARSLVLAETFLDATAAVVGHFDTAEGRLELEADHVRVTRLAPTVDGVGAEPVTLVADEVARVELLAPRGGFRLAARRVEVDGSAVTSEGGGAPDLLVSTVNATGAVDLAMDMLDGSLTLASGELRVERGAAALAESDGPREAAPRQAATDSLTDAFHLTAQRVDEVELRRAEGTSRASCATLDLRGRFTGRVLEPTGSVLVATGDVTFEEEGPAGLSGECQRLTLEDGERALLEPAPGGRVEARGTLPGRGPEAPGMPYTLEADRLVHRPNFLEALQPDVRLEGLAVPFAASAGAVLTEARAGRLVATPDEIVLDGGMVATGQDRDGIPIRLKLDTFRSKPRPGLLPREAAAPIERAAPRAAAPTTTATTGGDGGAGGDGGGLAPQDDEPPVRSALQDVFQEAEGSGLEMTWGGLTVRGAELTGSAADVLEIRGDAVHPAVIEYEGMSLEATWLRFDFTEFLIEAGRGIIRSAPGPEEWSLGFASIDRVLAGDESLVVIASPRLVRGRDEARADWVSLWVLRDAWRAMGRATLFGEGEAPKPPPPAFVDRDIPGPDLLADALLRLQRQEFASYARALYAEGDIEITQDDARASRADALYLDVGRAAGWLENAELVYRVEAGSRSELVRIRADRLETDGSGRLTADRATLTTCDHDDPHYVVLTRQLALEPREDGRWRFGASGNRLRFASGLQVPLPSLGNAVLDERGEFEGFENEKGEVTPLSSLTLAQTARFGASIGASFGFEVGSAGRWFADLIGMNLNILRGRWDTEAKWLGSRGPLVSALLDLRERKPRDEVGEDFRLQLFLSGIPDRGEDRGVLRVDEAERSEERFFGWARGRYPIVRGEWVDVAVAGQTDAGVQPEFFEDEFLRWDERDTFVRWRKAVDGIYYQAGVSKRIDSYRSDVEELPSAGVYVGKRQVGAVGPWTLLYGGSLDVANLRRREGDPGRDPFSEVPGPFAAGLDGRETVRGVLRQRLDLAAPTGVAGIRALPYVELDATGWTEDFQEQDDASRFALLGGMELTTALHAQQGGFTSVLAPRIGARTDLAYERSGLSPTPFDEVERPLDGTVYEAGLRGLWTRPGTFENLDLDARLMRIEDREGAPDTTELGLLGQWITRVGGDAEGLLGIQHDARYDIEDGGTTYTRSTVAWSPGEDFIVEGRYARARSFTGQGLYEAVGIDSRWTLDPKWELGVRHEWSLKGEGSLNTGVTVRRFAHDFLLEFDVSRRAGEGGTSFGISFSPLLAWKRPRLGMLERR